jgi:EAL domain-containing protein (putative c-di-GMP-specific phosphodiesterase class I)
LCRADARAEQAETLHRLGYRYAQGYHFSRPLTPIEVSGHLERTRTTLPV